MAQARNAMLPSVIGRALILTISLAGGFTLSATLQAQMPEAPAATFPSGFAQPMPPSAPHPEPGIFRPLPRTAGAVAHQPPPVTAAGWTSQGSNASQPPPLDSTTTAESKLPFNPPMKDASPTQLKKTNSHWSSTISMLMSLLLVLALFLGIAWFFRGATQHAPRFLSKDVVQVLGRTPLAPRHQMILIRFGRKLVLVSQQLGQTQTLSEIEDPQEVDHLLGLCEENSASSISNSFRNVLSQLANGKNSHDSSATTGNPSIARGI